METDPINTEIIYDFFTDESPSDAYGEYRGKKFYFYARWDAWKFAISEDSDVDPGLILEILDDMDIDQVQKSDQPLPASLIAAANRGFFKRGTYGKPWEYAASHMSKEEKLRIIRDCIAEYDGRGAG